MSLPPPPRALQVGHYWNVWPEALDPKLVNIRRPRSKLLYQPVGHLTLNRKYLIAVHLGAYAYRPEETAMAVFSSAVGEAFTEALMTQTTQSVEPWELRVIVLPGPLFITRPIVLAEPLQIDLGRVRKIEELPTMWSEESIWEKLQQRREEKKPLPDFVFGEIAFVLETGNQTGATSVGISIWDDATERPVEEIFFPVCIAEATSDCPESVPSDSLAGPGLLDLAKDQTQTGLPDASLHIFELPDRVVGVFYEKNEARKSHLENYYPWTISASPAISRDALMRQQARFSTEPKKAVVGEALSGVLFSNGASGGVAQARLSKFLEDHRSPKPFESAAPARFFVRMVLSEGRAEGRLAIFPLGLLNFDRSETGFLGFQVKVETPLPRQNYQPTPRCLDDWLMILPAQPIQDPDLKAAMQAVESTPAPPARLAIENITSFRLGEGKAPVYNDFGLFRDWLEDPKKPNGDSAAVIILSHHDNGSLYFLKDGPHLTAEEFIGKSFTRPSMAILSSCSTLSVGADAVVHSLNASGIETIIATNSQVSGSLAGDFLACLIEELEKAAPSPITASDLFYRAQRCTWEKPLDAADANSPSKYGAQVLSFSLAGNPSLTLCTPGAT